MFALSEEEPYVNTSLVDRDEVQCTTSRIKTSNKMLEPDLKTFTT
jgi:hypothetical protein